MASSPGSKDDHFDIDHLLDDLRGRSIRGGAATLLSQVGKFVLNVGATMILARILAPEAFGLLAMVVAVTSFVTLFKDLGLSMATVQQAEVSGEQVNALFWINVAVSAGVTLVMGALSPAIAWFYAEPRLVEITLALATGLLVSGFSVQHQALMKRQMRFTALAVVEVAATLGSVLVAVAAAWQDTGYWALVFQQLSRELFITLGSWIACTWRPGRPAWASGLRSMLAFGGNLTGFRLVNYFARNADDILIGRFVGAQGLGYYTKAYKLLLAPIELIRRPISNVVIPSLSRLQDNPERFRSYSMRALSIIVFLSMPLTTFAFAEADRLVLFVLGPQWDQTAQIFRVLAAAAFVQSFNMVTGWSFTALGQTDRWFKWGLFSSSTLVASFVIGINWGAYGVAVAYAASNYLLLVPSFIYCFKTSHLGTSQIFRNVWKPALASVAAAGFVLGINHFANQGSLLIGHLIVSTLGFALAYLGSWAFLPGGTAYLTKMYRLAQELLPS